MAEHEVDTRERVTRLEVISDQHTNQHGSHFETHAKHDQRLSLVEKAILALAGAVYILAQEKFPVVAHLLKGLIP
jgi:hypothetical protein